MGVHTIDNVHPPGMVIPAAMMRHQRIVAAALSTKSSALTVRKSPRRAGLRLVCVTL